MGRVDRSKATGRVGEWAIKATPCRPETPPPGPFGTTLPMKGREGAYAAAFGCGPT